MMLRTHLAIVILFIILFLPHVSSKFLFVVIALLATVVPDIDTGFSTIGSKGIFRIVQVFVKHRGFFHSLTFCIFVSIILAFFLPVLSLGFFLGYSIHLFADSFTKEGITPFWPYKKISSWHFKTGGRVETTLFVIFLLLDLLLFVLMVQNIV